ncbi:MULTISPECIES: alpha/beta hydrolase family protein [unclassified Aureimonas]|uniref:alpha/beta hydrolase family protein n=1 Tax=unclassified Aureimonas TaxID=2615206 RepID=UPI0006F97FAB|nr:MULTISPECIES: dienelactone hydrolase family protein [unclassified Aureimonas]KQT53901.1 hypothetical protein ASG62_11755 [Aureimonas sp. Leaf427]KQT71657.1 hypothetical protein ASG54_19405 [Aureimonas sp. Leaf460]
MIRFLKPLLLVAFLASGASSTAAAAETVGTTTLAVASPERDRPLQVTLWYPAGEGGTLRRIGANPLFVGTQGFADAPVVPGRHPLIVLSHGSGGRAANLGWLAGSLAARGFVVAAPDHPGTTGGDSRPSETVKIWERPADLSAVVTGLEADEAWAGAVDPGRVGAVGFSLGGFSVLALAGARADAAAYADYCSVDRGAMSDCAWYARGGVDLRRLDGKRFGGSFEDPRIRTVVAVDPALAQAYRADSLKGIAIPVHFLNLGKAGTTWLGVEASGLAPLVPGASLDRIADADHFSFLGECRADGAEILRREGETDPLCDDAGGRSRRDIHDDIARLVGDALARDLD